MQKFSEIVKKRVYPLRNLFSKASRKKTEESCEDVRTAEQITDSDNDVGRIVEEICRETGKLPCFRTEPAVEYIYADAIPEKYTIYRGEDGIDFGEIFVSVSYKPDYYFPLSVFDEQMEAIEKDAIINMLKGIGARTVKVQKVNPLDDGRTEGSSMEELVFDRPSEFYESKHPFILDHRKLSDFQYKNYNNSAPKTDVLFWKDEADYSILDDIANELRKKHKNEKRNRYCIGTIPEYHFYIDSFFDKLISEEWIQQKSKAVLGHYSARVEKSLAATGLFLGGVVTLILSRSWEGWLHLSLALFLLSYIFIAIAVVKAAVAFVCSKISKKRGEVKEPWYQKVKRIAKLVEHVCTEHEEDRESEIVLACDKLVRKTVLLLTVWLLIFVLLFIIRGWAAKHFYDCSALEILALPFKAINRSRL